MRNSTLDPARRVGTLCVPTRTNKDVSHAVWVVRPDNHKQTKVLMASVAAISIGYSLLTKDRTSSSPGSWKKEAGVLSEQQNAGVGWAGTFGIKES